MSQSRDELRVQLWNAIHRYADAGPADYGNTTKQVAVVSIEASIEAIQKPPLASAAVGAEGGNVSRLSKEREAAIDNMLDSTTHSRLELQAALYDQQQELRAVRSELDEARRERDRYRETCERMVALGGVVISGETP